MTAFDMIADMVGDKRLEPIVTALFLLDTKLTFVLLLSHSHTSQIQLMLD